MNHLIAYRNPNAEVENCRHSGLGITANNIADVLTEHQLPSIALAVRNGEHLWNHLIGHRDITHVTVCAPFFETEFLEQMCRAFPHIQFTVTYHSNWGFLQQDQWAVKCIGSQLRLQKSIRNFRISGNCEAFSRATEAAFLTPVLTLPNLYWLHGPVTRSRPAWSGGDLHIGVFGATRTLKNLLTGVVASCIMGRMVRAQRTFVHTSSGRVEHGDGVVGSVRQLFEGPHERGQFELVEEPWAAWPDFQLKVRSMDLLVQPSFTESFNSVTADGVTQGVASVTGPAIDWVPEDWHADPDDACAVAAAGVALLADPTSARRGGEALMAHNEHGVNVWRKWLTKEQI